MLVWELADGNPNEILSSVNVNIEHWTSMESHVKMAQLSTGKIIGPEMKCD